MDHCELDRSEQIEIQTFYSKKNAFENTVCEIAAILSWPLITWTPDILP